MESKTPHSPSLFAINVFKQCYSQLREEEEDFIYTKLPYRTREELMIVKQKDISECVSVLKHMF